VIEAGSKTLLDLLLLQYPGTARTRAKQWIAAGRVTLNGAVIRKANQSVAETDTIELGGRHTTTLDCGSGLQIHPRVSLLHLDSAVAVINKAPGLISVPGPGAELSALSILGDFLAGRLKVRNRDVDGRSLPPAYRRIQPLPVHRLDQYTSGVFCLATNPTARQRLIDQVQTHRMQREYIAFVEGRPRAAEGTWRQWLQLSGDELRQEVVATPRRGTATENIREAITHYQVMAEYPLADRKGFVTKLRLRLETGLKHQIRIQAAHVGLPLIGDRMYNPAVRALASSIEFPRQALHSELLGLEHPDRPGTRITWTAELPKDLRQLEAALRAGRF
jgi:23S rRNA pseudouridine1911/1915/1917 synthase